MKKYDLSGIMKRAWALVRKLGWTISQGLKRAWKEAKTVNVVKPQSYLWKRMLSLSFSIVLTSLQTFTITKFRQTFGRITEGHVRISRLSRPEKTAATME